MAGDVRSWRKESHKLTATETSKPNRTQSLSELAKQASAAMP